MQTQNRIFDDLARVAGGALGALSGVREEIELLVRGRLERVLAEMDLVPRDEFDAVKAMAAEARAENERLAARIAVLEEQAKAKAKVAAPKAAAASPASTRRRSVRRDVTSPKAKATKGRGADDTRPEGPEDKS